MRLFLAALLAAAVPATALAQEAARDNIDALIAEQARVNKVPEAFVHRVVKRESNYNAHAKGGSALGLMQIKHATARGLGYTGDAAGLYDPATNLKYGIAYLAGAYRAAKGDLEQAYRYYNRGYYYAAKRLGIDAAPPDDEGTTTIASAAQPAGSTAAGAVAKSANGFDGLFAQRAGAPAAATQALAYAAPGPAPTDAVEVPLPPRRPTALSAAEPVQMASLQPAAPAAAPVPPQPAQAAAQAVQPIPVALADAVEVPLPPRRPSETMLAALARPAVARRSTAPILEASAAPGTP